MYLKWHIERMFKPGCNTRGKALPFSDLPRASSSGAGTEAQSTLNMLLSHCRCSPEGRAFLYDELALSAGSGALEREVLDTLTDMLVGE